MVEIVNMRQMRNALWKCALTMKFRKVTKYALFYSSVIVLKISRFFFFFAIAAVRDLCWR